MLFIKIQIKQLVHNNFYLGSLRKRWCAQCSFFFKKCWMNHFFFKLNWCLQSFKKFLFFLSKTAANRGRFWFIARNTYLGYVAQHYALSTRNLYISGKAYGGQLTNAYFNQRYHENFLILLQKNKRFFPSAAIALDTMECSTIAWDATKIQLPLGGLCDTDTSPQYYNYVLLGNNKSFFSNLFLGKLSSEAILLGQQREWRCFFKNKLKSKI